MTLEISKFSHQILTQIYTLDKHFKYVSLFWVKFRILKILEIFYCLKKCFSYNYNYQDIQI